MPPEVFNQEEGAGAETIPDQKYPYYATCPHCSMVHNIGWPDSKPAGEIQIECECGERFIYDPYKGVM